MQDKLTRYFDAMDGSHGWEDIAPLYDEVMHDDVVIVTADGDRTKEQWAETVRGLLAKGARVSDVEMTEPAGDEFHYKLTITVGDTVMNPASKATIKDGRLARVEPVDPGVYSEIAARGA